MRLHDWNGDGLVEVGLLPRILSALLTFRADEASEEMVETALGGYEMTLYQESCMMITEEEFVYDSNTNRQLSEVVKQCDGLVEFTQLVTTSNDDDA